MMCMQRSIYGTCSFLSDQLSRILYSDKPAWRGSNFFHLGDGEGEPLERVPLLNPDEGCLYCVGIAVEYSIKGDELDAGANGRQKGDLVEIEDV